MNGETARELVSNGAALIDVRTPGEFASGHIDGAVNIPVQELAQRLGEVPQGPVVLYCRSGARSGNAANFLLSEGWTEVYNLGPMSAW